MTAVIRTVRGDISPDALGMTYLHEHLSGRSLKPGGDPDLALDSEVAAAADLIHFRMAGGSAMVEMSPRDWSRDAASLRRLSEATGVHIVAVTGYLKGSSAEPLAADRSVEDLADEMIREVQTGIDDTGIRAGVIKAGSSLDRITPLEERLFAAAARAHHATGAPISTHTEAGTMALEQIALLTGAGVKPDRLLIGHLDRHLDWDYHQAIAQTGVTLGYDQFSKEKYAPDRARIDFIVRMVEAGYGAQIAVSGDMARRSDLTGYGGGPGYTFILWRIIPWMRKAGLSDAAIRILFVETPRRLLTIAG